MSQVTTAQLSYSYQGQDLFVVETLRGKRGGFFLDSGASGGTRGSNSLLLEKEFGWRGICVEPNDAMFAELSATRACACFNCCLSDAEGEVDFLEAAGVYGGIVDCYDPDVLRRLRNILPELGGPDRPLPIARKAGRTIASILRMGAAPGVIDYWSLDTEGSELALLKAFPFDRYSVRVITVEHNCLPARGAIRKFLEAKGFRFRRDLGIDDAFVYGQSSHWRGAWRRRLAGRAQ